MHLLGGTPTDYFVASPIEDPLSYPGLIPPHSYLLVGPGQLRRLRLLTAPDGRRAVLAVGSNASPAQLVGKFAAAGLSCVVPVIEASAGRLRVLPSAHVNKAGYFPWAPADAGDNASSAAAFVTFLDSEQLARMDQTEPNYVRTPLSPSTHPVRLAGSEEPLAQCDVYVSKHGVIIDDRVVGSGPLPDQRTLIDRVLTIASSSGQTRYESPDQLVASVRNAGLMVPVQDISATVRIGAAGL